MTSTPSPSRPRITSIASGFSSISTNRRPSMRAASPVVPLPANGSSTQSPGSAARGDDPAQHAERLLRHVPRLLPPGRRDDRVPPDVRGQLAERGLLRRDQAGRHVGLAVDLRRVEQVPRRILHVDEDRVVLRGPPAGGPRAVVVRPDDLVEEALAAEQRVEQHLRVVDLALVEVEVEGAVLRQEAPRLLEPRLEERPVVGERVVVARDRALHDVVGAAVEAHPGAADGVVAGDRRAAQLLAAGVERRIEVGEPERAVRQRAQHREVVALDDEVGSERRPGGLRGVRQVQRHDVTVGAGTDNGKAPRTRRVRGASLLDGSPTGGPPGRTPCSPEPSCRAPLRRSPRRCPAGRRPACPPAPAAPSADAAAAP